MKAKRGCGWLVLCLLGVLLLAIAPDKPFLVTEYEDGHEHIEVTWDGGSWSYYNWCWCPVWRDDPLHDPPTHDGWARSWGYSGVLIYTVRHEVECNLPGISTSNTFAVGWRPGAEKGPRVSVSRGDYNWRVYYYSGSEDRASLFGFVYYPKHRDGGYGLSVGWEHAPWCDKEHIWTCNAFKQAGEPWSRMTVEDGPPR